MKIPRLTAGALAAIHEVELSGLAAVAEEVKSQTVADTADRVVAELRGSYRRGLLKAKFSPDEVTRFSAGPFALFVPRSPEQAAIHKNIGDLGARINRWATQQRKWAESKQRDDGTPYSWDLWIKQGQVLNDAIRSHAGEAWNTGPLMALIDTVKATGEQITDPSKMPDWLKYALYAAGAIVVLSTLAPFLSSYAQLRSAQRGSVPNV